MQETLLLRSNVATDFFEISQDEILKVTKKQRLTTFLDACFVIVSSDFSRHVYVCKSASLAYALHHLMNVNVVCATNNENFAEAILNSRNYFATHKIIVFCENESDAVFAKNAAKEVSAKLLINSFASEFVQEFLVRSR